jgi:hypothetical protein
MTLLWALLACAPPPSTATLELVSAERFGELRFRLRNSSEAPIELAGYNERGTFHLDWHSRVLSCADDATSDYWFAPREPLVGGVFTGIRMQVKPGDSAELVVNHMARLGGLHGICRVIIRLDDGSELVSASFPSRRLTGGTTN